MFFTQARYLPISLFRTGMTRGMCAASLSAALLLAVAAPAPAWERSHTAATAPSATRTNPGGREVRIGAAPVLPPGASLLAGVASLQTMRITVALAPRDPVALRSYATGVGSPSSPFYRRYLTPSQFRARFAPRRSTLVRVQSELRSHGLHPGPVAANGLAIPVVASGAAIERAFSLSLVRVRLANGRDAVYNSRAPAVDARVAPDIQAVIGLSSIAVMQRLDVTHKPGPAPNLTPSSTYSISTAHVATGGPQPCVKATQVAPGQGAYTADQIATAYGFSGVYAGGDLGQGVTIGVYELEPNLPSDIAAYQRCYGTHTKISYTKVDGGAGGGAGAGEAALDIEQLIGLAPGARLIVYQGPNNNSDNPGTGPYDTLAAMVTQDQVQVISNSWGECEQLEGATDAHAENTLLEEAATQGQTFVSAAGDTGSEDCWSPPPGGNTNNALTVDDPASQPFAIGVGGTSLTAIGPPPAEYVWNNDNPNINYARFGIQPGAGGGGVSTFWPMPSWQSGTAASLAVIGANSSAAPCAAAAGTYCRQVPDVSAAADPMYSYLDYWNGTASYKHGLAGWQGTGGTSGAAPVWAALFALADASRACRGTLIGFAAPSLYALASQSQSTYFNDVNASPTAPNNDFTPSGNTSGLYPVAPGYDMATGLGSPNAAALVPALCAQGVKIRFPGQQYAFYGQRVRIALHASVAVGQSGPVSFHAQRLPAGLHLNQRTGVISGHPLQPGVRTVTAGALSGSGARGAIQFTWTVERRPRITTRFLGVRNNQRLRLQVRAGAYEPKLTTLIIGLPATVSLSRSADSFSVLGPNLRPVAYRSQLSGHLLTIRLARAHSPVEVVFPAGALRVRGGMKTAVNLTIGVVDRLGGHIVLQRQVRGL